MYHILYFNIIHVHIEFENQVSSFSKILILSSLVIFFKIFIKSEACIKNVGSLMARKIDTCDFTHSALKRRRRPVAALGAKGSKSPS